VQVVGIAVESIAKQVALAGETRLDGQQPLIADGRQLGTGVVPGGDFSGGPVRQPRGKGRGEHFDRRLHV
jgi:hypothetical protein